VKRPITVADAIFAGGGLLAFLFSFFGFLGYRGFDTNAWGSGLFPLATIPAILGLAAVVVVALDLFADVKLPAQVLTLNWKQIRMTWGITAAVIMLAYLILDKGSASLQFGGFVMLIGAILMAAGSIMSILGKGAEAVNLPKSSPGSPPSTPPAAPPPPPPAS